MLKRIISSIESTVKTIVASVKTHVAAVKAHVVSFFQSESVVASVKTGVDVALYLIDSVIMVYTLPIRIIACVLACAIVYGIDRLSALYGFVARYSGIVRNHLGYMLESVLSSLVYVVYVVYIVDSFVGFVILFALFVL